MQILAGVVLKRMTSIWRTWEAVGHRWPALWDSGSKWKDSEPMAAA